MSRAQKKLVYQEVLGQDNKRSWLVRETSKEQQQPVSRKWKNKLNKGHQLFSNFFQQVFLPQGYPNTVHPDYTSYQIWDTVQAFASTILGALTTHSIMRGIGVGDSTATPLAAAITMVLKDGTGMIGRILFAWWAGPRMDAECKKWRLFADYLNDLAMGIELMIPYFSSYSIAVLSTTSIMKSLVGVAGGATRAAIIQHQASNNNLADVSAKDGSQETCVNLVASLVGVFLLSYTDVSSYVVLYFTVLAAIHIYANYSAVRSLCFNTFNEDRLAILIGDYLSTSKVSSPEEINKREPVWAFQKSKTKELCGYDIVIGKSLNVFTTSNKFRIFPNTEARTIYVALGSRYEQLDLVEAYIQSFLRALYLSMKMNFLPNTIFETEMQVDSRSVSYLYNAFTTETSSDSSQRAKIKVAIADFSKTFIDDINKTDWSLESNLLPVQPWTGNWGLPAAKELNDELTSIEEPITF